MLINLSNHPSSKWGSEQMTAASAYDEIVDLSFPVVDAAGDETYIASLVDDYVLKVQELADGKLATVHLMGEMTFTFALVKRLQAFGIRCVASTTERVVLEQAPNKKEVLFKFVRFREYE